MGAKPVLAGMLWLLFAASYLFGFLGIIAILLMPRDLVLRSMDPVFLSLILPETAYSALSLILAVVLGIGFAAAGIGLLKRKKWSFKAGIAVPAVDILASVALTAWPIMVPGTVPAGIETAPGLLIGVAATILLELAGIALVLKSKGELVK